MLKLLQGPFRIYKNLLHKDHLYKDPAGFGRTLKIKKGKRRKDNTNTMHSNMCVGEDPAGFRRPCKKKKGKDKRREEEKE